MPHRPWMVTAREEVDVASSVSSGAPYGRRRLENEVMRTKLHESPDGFELLRVLGEGGAGIVYEALDLSRGQCVALKTFKRSGSEALFRLKQEFRRLSQLRHDHWVELYEMVVEGELAYLELLPRSAAACPPMLVSGRRPSSPCRPSTDLRLRSKPPPTVCSWSPRATTPDGEPISMERRPKCIASMQCSERSRCKGNHRVELTYDGARLTRGSPRSQITSIC